MGPVAQWFLISINDNSSINNNSINNNSINNNSINNNLPYLPYLSPASCERMRLAR